MSYSKVSIYQTASNAAATLVANGVTDLEGYRAVRDELYSDLLSILEAEQAEAPAASAKPAFSGPKREFNDARGGDFIVFFGQKHKGKTVRDIFSEDPSYVKNFLTKSTIGKAKTAAEEFLASL